MAERPLLVIDCPPGAPGTAMRVAGMSVLERLVREHCRRGGQRVLIRGNERDLPALPELPCEIDVTSPGAPVPPGAERARGDQLLGVTVDGEAARRSVEWALLQTCRRPYDGPGDRYVIRSLSLRITRWLTTFSITPNQVTAVSLALGLTAVLLIAAGGYAAVALGGALLFAQVVLDSVDGELSRVRHMGSRLGMWLDNLSDDLLDNLIVIGLGVGLGEPWAAVGVAASLGRGFSAFVTYRGAAAAGSPGDVMAFRWWFEDEDASAAEAFNEPASPITALRSLGRRDTYMLVYAASCILGVPAVAFGLGALNGIVYFGMAVAHLVARRGRF